MSEEVDRVGYQQLNFQIALDKIETLAQQNNELLDRVDELEKQLKDATDELNNCITHPLEDKRFNNASAEADAAMKRFTAKLKKEINKNAKSKQSQGQPV